MSLPYFRMYPTDFEADTAHLTLEEDGAYNRLMRLCWRTPGCSLPNDPQWIMRRLRVSQDEYDRVVSIVLDEFFIVENRRVSNKRLLSEFNDATQRHEAASINGKKGGRPRKPLKVNETEKAKGFDQPKLNKTNQNQNHTTLSKDKAAAVREDAPVCAASLIEKVEVAAGADSSKSQHWATTGIQTAQVWLDIAKASGVGDARAEELILLKVSEIRAREPSQQISRPSFFNKAIDETLRRENLNRTPGGFQSGKFGKPRVKATA